MTLQEIKDDILIAVGTAVFLYVAWVGFTVHAWSEAFKASLML